MSLEVKLPELGEGVTEGELVKWLVKPGDSVSADQPIAEMMTDKATVEVPSPQAGVVESLQKKEGDVVPVGQVLIMLKNGGAQSAAKPSAPAPAAKAAPAAVAPQAAKSAASTQAPPSKAAATTLPPADVKVLATPATRRLAREMGVDINGIQGSGLAGRVTRDDLGTATGGSVSAPSTPKPGMSPGPVGQESEERVPLRGIRKKIAENMQMAKHIIPHFTLMDEIDVTSLVQLRTDLKNNDIKVTYLPFVIKALIATVKDFPQFNASIDDDKAEIAYKKHFHIGFAADTPQGLMVPVIKFADQKTISELSQSISQLAQKARDGKLALDEMRGATITVTNIGSVGGMYATPIINHPEVAILGMYKIQTKQELSKNAAGGIDIKERQMMNFTITADHRLIDGAVAANFLKAFGLRLQSIGRLMLDLR